jgi:metal-responsive CopG/Arc/MetJ family transcriptional regulator
MKTAISIPDAIFADAERLAERLGTSRSKLYAQAIEEFVSRHEEDDVSLTEQINAVIREIGGCDSEFAKEAGRQMLRRNEW